MFSSLIITFRETFEVALVVGIVLTFLSKTNMPMFKKYVWRGVGIGLLISTILAICLGTFFGGFKGASEQLFEGILMFITAGFLTWMIMWVHRQKGVAKKLKENVAVHANKGYGLGIAILVATSVFREGTETALYLKASSLVDNSNQFIGATLGILLAIGLGYALFKWALKINLNIVFNITSVFLIMFAAGLVAHGVHELQEIKYLPIFSFDPIYNISAFIDHQSTFGSFLRTLFGYSSTPTILELISYSSYIFIILMIQYYAFFFRILYRKASK